MASVFHTYGFCISYNIYLYHETTFFYLGTIDNIFDFENVSHVLCPIW
jgi:hypothetical protein